MGARPVDTYPSIRTTAIRLFVYINPSRIRTFHTNCWCPLQTPVGTLQISLPQYNRKPEPFYRNRVSLYDQHSMDGTWKALVR